MPASNEQRAAMLERRSLVVQLYIRRQDAPTIHRALAQRGIVCDQKTIYRDIKAIEKGWRDEFITDLVEIKAKELAAIEEAERECWLKYQTTQQRFWLSELRQWKERKAKMLGLDAPTKVQGEFTHDFPDEDPKQILLDRINLMASRASADGGSSQPS